MASASLQRKESIWMAFHIQIAIIQSKSKAATVLGVSQQSERLKLNSKTAKT
jgi:hypothetical protein